MLVTLIDTGILVALYDRADFHHDQVIEFLSNCRGQLITTLGCVTEVMWLLEPDRRAQNEFLHHLHGRVYDCEPMQANDFVRMAELNTQYSDLPADFADLSLVVISERLDISRIATLDKDFDIYRRYRSQAFERVFYPASR